MSRPLSILLLCDDKPGNANTILDHIDAFRRYSRHQVRTFNPRGMGRSLALDLGEFDVVVVHYSLVLSSERYVSRDFRDKLAGFRGLKVQFMQDEYRWVDRATAASREAGIRVLYTAAAEPAAGLLYDTRLPGVRRVHTLTGFVPESLRGLPRRPLRERPLDVGYRGRDLPYWLGRLTQEKQWIGQGFLERVAAYGLRADIAWREDDRLYGDRWVDFIASCRTTLGTESGASIADFDGRVERAVRTYLRAHRGAGFDEVHDAVLRPYEGNVVVNVISPRVFEAAALGTGLVMFPGEYSGIAVAGDHYIPLAKDFSNMDEVVEKLKDVEFMSGLTERANEDLVRSGRWSFKTFIDGFDDVVAEEATAGRGASRAPRHRLAGMERALKVPPLHVRATRRALTLAAAVRGKDFTRRSELESGAWLAKGSVALRAMMTDPTLRSIFRAGRKARIATDSLLEEILDLDLLRRAAAGALVTAEGFAVFSEWDGVTRSLRFVSSPAAETHPARSAQVDGVEGALRSGDVQSMEWDHSALGESIHLERPRLEIGIGANGVKRFSLLIDLAHDNPRLMERALAPMLGPREAVPSTIG
jgi:hypothetical protein